MDIPIDYIVQDICIKKEFKKITVCGYKKKDVLNTFQNCIINNKLEDAIRWCVELHCTALNNNIWDSIKNIYFKYIHINNPKFLFYLLKREKEYNNVILKYPKKHEIYTKNNQEIRNLYAELITISTITKKNTMFLPKSLPTINNKSFEKDDIHKRMISKDLEKINDYIFNTTTNEMKLALNEIANNLYSKNGTYENCTYWYLWLEKIENLKKKENTILFSNINSDHWIFILWNIINNIDENRIEKNNYTFLKKIYNEYIKNFKLSQISKKKYHVFIAFYIIKNNLNWNINIFQNEYLIIQTNANINSVYQNIIKNIDVNITEKAKQILDKTPKKVNNIINIDKDVNVVMFTNYPDYKDSLEVNSSDKDIDTKKELISKNMTLRDVEETKIEIKNKKLDALVNFVSYKKKTNKTVLDYYSQEVDETLIKNINISKKNK